jgi:prephenate dehydrogenase
MGLARDLYRRIDAEIVEQDAVEHDRSMAEGHALAYFVAKGFMDAGVDLERPSSPPSVQAIARTVQAVREDSAHLFASLHRENPFAEEARRRLLDALHRVDDALRAPRPADEEAHREVGPLHLDHLAPSSELLAARDVIDELDGELLQLLARRAQVALRAARAKREAGQGVRDTQREVELLEARREQAEGLGLDPASVSEVFTALLAFSRQFQRDHGSEP